MINPNPLMDTNEAADYLHCNPKTLTNDRATGQGPNFVKLGRLVRYRTSDLDAYIENGLVEIRS